MRVGGGRIMLDGYEIRLYFLSEWFVLRLLPWETIRQISISLHVGVITGFSYRAS